MMVKRYIDDKMDRAASRSWCVSGAGSGLGLALVKAAAEHGDSVAALVRRRESVEQINALGQKNVVPIVIDMLDRAALPDAVRACEAAIGPIDVLVNNAGKVLETTIEEADPVAIEALFAINVFAPIDLIRVVLPSMRARGTGRIINISSGGGFVGLPALGIYCATKFALEGMSEALAGELGGLGIHVTIVEPGSFRTDLLARNTQNIPTSFADYEKTCGDWRRRLQGMSGHEPNNPELFAQAMLKLVDHPRPPLRLPLGDDAINMVEEKLVAIATDIAPWRSVGGGLAFTN